MRCLSLRDTTGFNRQYSHHACDISARGALLLIPTTFSPPWNQTCFTFNDGHYHYSGLASVTTAAWISGPRVSPYPLLAPAETSCTP